MSVVAKFRCEFKRPIRMHNGGPVDGEGVALRAVYDPDPTSENGSFFKATPNGTIDIGIVSPEVSGYFEPGAEYRVTFERVERS